MGADALAQMHDLSEVRAAPTGRSYRGSGVSHDISVLLKSGREFALVGATTNQRGYQSAVNALNEFLRERSPVQ